MFKFPENGPPCEPFTMFMINCNKCVCSADGTPSCTKMDCDRIIAGWMQVASCRSLWRSKGEAFVQQWTSSG
ncbi:hypothetical protein MSG28_009358 [Choristoneura fumiferana]|uniref:Uncharacterized protein n=1 Tax=Choristoneura fumiferana TaxID=7141 RepID=A0ACC0KX27_CHOFU|nr:hypothetical protein MSG28_009358 [Choristoneura fumiferana]